MLKYSMHRSIVERCHMENKYEENINYFNSLDDKGKDNFIYEKLMVLEAKKFPV